MKSGFWCTNEHLAVGQPFPFFFSFLISYRFDKETFEHKFIFKTKNEEEKKEAKLSFVGFIYKQIVD